MKKRYENLDGLRAIACMGIAAMHLYCTQGYLMDGIVHRIILSWALFVILFMMLSGFGICAGYLRKFSDGSISLEAFYARRFSKILPFFAVTTVLGVAAERSFRGVLEGIMELSLLFGLLPNSNCFNVNGVCWTLGTIFAFYLLFPFVSVLLKSRKRAWMALAALMLIQVLCGSLFMQEPIVVEGYIGRTSVLYSLAFFLAGGLIYLCREEIEGFVRKHQWIVLLACLAVTIIYYLTPDVIGNYFAADFKAMVMFAGWSIYAIGARSFILNNRLMKLIADSSMEIYLSHMIVIKGMSVLGITELMDKNAISFILMFLVLMVGTGLFVKIVKLMTAWLGKQVEKRIERVA